MKVGLIFPGYGSQFVGMAKELYDNSRIIQEYFEEASSCLNTNFVKLCFASSDFELSKVTNAYPALFLVSFATAAMLKEMGIPVHSVAGYGTGEYGAMSFAGGLSFPDGLYLISKLAKFYVQIREQLDIKSVTINGLTSKKLQQICKEHSSENCCAQIAVYENSKEHLVTGHSDAVDAVIEAASFQGASKSKKDSKAVEGFHTPMLNDLFDQLQIYLTKVDFKDLSIPLISNVDGKIITAARKAQDIIMAQIIRPIYWTNVLKQFSDVDLLIIPAPAKILTKEIKAYYPDKVIIGIDSISDIAKLSPLFDNLEMSAISLNESTLDLLQALSENT